MWYVFFSICMLKCIPNCHMNPINFHVIELFSKYTKLTLMAFYIKHKLETVISDISFNPLYPRQKIYIRIKFILLTGISDLYTNANNSSFVCFENNRFFKYLPVKPIESDFRCGSPRRYLRTLTFNTILW